MGRLHVFEFEDYDWYPMLWRDLETDFLRFFNNASGAYKAAVPLIAAGLGQAERQVVDLCSGAAGPWPALLEDVEASCGRPLRVTLTDKFPNLAAFADAQEASGGRIDFVASSVDATSVPPKLSGMRTMFTALHHFPPAAARRILQDAFASRRPIGIFEVTGRTPAALLGAFWVPTLMMLSAPFLRPLRISRLLYTWLIPVVPWVTLWNGVASCFRTYSPSELLDLVQPMSAPDYAWEIGQVRWRWWAPTITFVVGRPIDG